MKSSTALMGVWFLLVFGLAWAGVWFFMKDRQPDTTGETKPVILDPSKGTTVPKPGAIDPKTGKPVQQNRTRRPVTPSEIRGRVLDAESKPLQGVAVSILPPGKNVPPPPPAASADEIRRVGLVIDIAVDELENPRPLSMWAEIPATSAARFEGEPLAKGDTDAEGRFLLKVPPGTRGPVRVVARSETLGSASRTDVKIGEMNLDLVIATAGVVTGSVMSEATGNPVPNARVAFASADREWNSAADANGAFRVEDMPAGRYKLRAGAPGYVPILDQEITVARGEPVSVKLPKGATLRVRAVKVDENGDPRRPEDGPAVANAEIVALDENTFAYVVGRTDTNGVVEFSGLPAGSWLVNGRAEGVVPVGEEHVMLKPTDGTQDVLVQFDPAVMTTIDVVDEEGQPVAGMEFFAADPDEEYHAVHSEKLAGASDARGRYQFPFEFMGRRSRIFGFKKGYAAVSIVPEDNEEESTMRVVAHKAVRVFGVVRTPDGQPVPGASVLITVTPGKEASEEDLFDDSLYHVVAGTDGRYEFPYIPSGWPVTIEAETADGSFFADEMEDIEPVKDTELNFTIDMTMKVRGMSLPGTPVKDGAGKPEEMKK